MDTDTWMGAKIPQTYYQVPGINMHHTILLCSTNVKSPNKAKLQKMLFVPGGTPHNADIDIGAHYLAIDW